MDETPVEEDTFAGCRDAKLARLVDDDADWFAFVVLPLNLVDEWRLRPGVISVVYLQPDKLNVLRLDRQAVE